MKTIELARRVNWPDAAAIAVLVVIAAVVMQQTTVVIQQHNELLASADDAAWFQAELRRLEREQERASSRLQSIRSAVPAAPDAALPAADPAVEAAADDWLRRVQQLRQLAASRVDLAFPEIGVLSEREWFTAAKDPKLGNEQQIRDTFRDLRSTARATLARLLQVAVSRHADAHDGALPESADQLAPFTEGRVSPELLGRFDIAHRGSLATTPGDEPIVVERAALVLNSDSRVVVTRREHTVDDLTAVPERELRRALRAFVEVNPGRLPQEPVDLLPYFKSPLQPAAVSGFMAKPRSDFSREALEKLMPSEWP